MSSSSIFLSAGDPSGDNASARLVACLLQKLPGVSFFGLGGTKLGRLGQKQLAEPQQLAVLGFWEVARHYLFFRRLFSECVHEIETNRPRAIILVDYPGFNLRLAARIKRLGIPIIYYISPQVWAWGKRRVKAIRELVDLMLVILPFENDFYTQHGVESEFVGHYLLEDIPNNLINSTPPESQSGTLAVLPGSRPQEIQRMLPSMLKAARMFNQRYGTRAVVAGMSNTYDYERAVNTVGGGAIDIIYDNARQVIADSRWVLTASGTATLEAAIIGRPMVVVYKTGMLTYMIARKLVKLDKIALANLVLDEKVLPELIQGEASPQRMFSELARMHDDSSYYSGIRGKLQTVSGLLGGEGASERAAQLIEDLLGW